MVAFATASAAASNTTSAEWTYLLVMLCILWPSKLAMVGSLYPRSAARLANAVARHTGRDVGRQITQRGDPWPHLAIANNRRLAGSTGEHHIAAPRLGLDNHAGQFLTGGGAMPRSWYQPVEQFVAADRLQTIAVPGLRRVAIPSGSSAM
jgi:hypothetical protein